MITETKDDVAVGDGTGRGEVRLVVEVVALLAHDIHGRIEIRYSDLDFAFVTEHPREYVEELLQIMLDTNLAVRQKVDGVNRYYNMQYY